MSKETLHLGLGEAVGTRQPRLQLGQLGLEQLDPGVGLVQLPALPRHLHLGLLQAAADGVLGLNFVVQQQNTATTFLSNNQQARTSGDTT